MSQATCPHCGRSAIEITLAGDPYPRYMCGGFPVHEWFAGDEYIAEEEPEVTPGILSKLKALFH